MQRLLLLLVCLCPAWVGAQTVLPPGHVIDLSGVWRGVGEGTDSLDPYRTTTRIYLRQLNGKLSGLSRTELEPKEFATSRLSGSVKGEAVEWTELDVVPEETTRSEDYDWCFSHFVGKLRITAEGCFLDGIAKPTGLKYNAAKHTTTTGLCDPFEEHYHVRRCMRDTLGRDLLPTGVQVTDSVVVPLAQVAIQYRDGDELDGDRVTISLGTEVLGKAVPLKRKYQSLKSVLVQPVTYLTVAADDGGKGGQQGVATTSLLIRSGSVEHRVELDPAPGKAKAVKLILKP